MSDSNRSVPSKRSRPARRLPINPSLEHLRKQARRLARSDPSLTLQQAQHELARAYGSANWAELARVVEAMAPTVAPQRVGTDQQPLPAAANRNDLAGVRAILETGPFTQLDLDVALARSVLRFRERKQIAELLVEHGADPDGQYGGNYGPIVFVTGECLDPDGLQFLIDAGADVTFEPIDTKYGRQCPMSYALGSYMRDANARKHRMIEILIEHKAYIPAEVTPAMLAVHRGDAATLATLIDADRSLLIRRFPTMPYGNIDLRGGTLLHLAVEMLERECVDLLLDRGANLNARAQPIAESDGTLIGDQTPVYHCIAACQGAGTAMLAHLINRAGVDLSITSTFRAIGEAMAVVSPAISPLQWAERSRSDAAMSWRRASDREVALLSSI